MAYFDRLDTHRYRATEATGGAWAVEEQHIAPALGLLGHEILADRDARRDDGLQISRLSYDILGTVPVGDVDVRVDVLRPGRTIELVEARMSHAGRDIVVARCWLLAAHDTSRVAGTPLTRAAAPEAYESWDATTVWQGGMVASVELRRELEAPGRGRFWVRTATPLLDEPVSDTARLLGLLDLANGMSTRALPGEVAFPNVDLTVHLIEEPRGEWLGFDTSVSFGHTGLGLTSSVIHDVHGPIGTLNQSLTVRPR